MKNILLAIVFSLFSCFVMSQATSCQIFIEQVFGQDDEIYFQFRPDHDVSMTSLGRIISIDGISPEGIVKAYANRKEFERFLETGLDYQILPHPGDYIGILKMMGPEAIREIADWDFYPTYDGYVAMMYQFAADYPSLCQVFPIGTTVLGRELLVARISDNVGMSENEPQFLYTSSMHGDETTGYVLMLRLIDYLLTHYGSDDRITSMVNNIDIWINPLANPDGTYWGGNNSVNGARRYNAEAVDLNRNYPDPAEGPHPDGKAWQLETVAFMNLAEEQHFVASANIHGGTEVCNYPWDTWWKLSADDSWWIYVCREYADTAHLYAPPDYMNEYDNGITNGYTWYSITGGRQDYMNYFQQCREFTLEISDVKLLPPQQLPALWEYNYRSLLNYMEQSTFGVRGTVKDSLTFWPLAAEVYAILHEQDSSWVYSDMPVGNYHRLLPEGTYNIRYSAPGYYPVNKANVQVTNRQAHVLNVKLLAEGVGGLEFNSVSRGIQLFPNPVRDGWLSVASASIMQEITVHDMNGKEAASFRVYDNRYTADLTQLPPGQYILYFRTDKGLGARKVLLAD
jgi:hypothetical protein